MSIRARLTLTIALALAAILVVGSVVTYDHAQRKVRVEIDTARSVAANRVAQLIAGLPAAPDVQRELAAFVRAFNGDRHVQMMMIDSTGAVRMLSHPAQPEEEVPQWFYDFMAPRVSSTIMPLSGRASPITAAVVSVDPRAELAEVWNDLGLILTLLGLFVLLAFGLVHAVVGRSLRPLGELSGAFHRIGKGDYEVHLAERGPPELAVLARGCNAMTARLGEMAQRNRRLSEQLLRLQDEERAELARDLHDEVGPFLFAIDVEASAIGALARSGGPQEGEIGERVRSIKAAARHVSTHVRRILGTLRPGVLPGLGLKATLEDMLAELRERHADIGFGLDIAEGERGAEIDTLVHRVVREAVSNALRHGTPSRIRVAIRDEPDAIGFSVTDDGGGLRESANGRGGYGLIGMRERVEAMGGSFSVRRIHHPAGVGIEGSVPLGARRAAAAIAEEAA